MVLVVKNPPADAEERDASSILGLVKVAAEPQFWGLCQHGEETGRPDGKLCWLRALAGRHLHLWTHLQG